MHSHSCLVVIKEFAELVRVTDKQFAETKEPFVDVDRAFVANGSRLQKIVGIFLRFGLSNVLLDILIESNCLVQIYGFQVVKIDIVEYFSQLLFMLFR